MSTEENEKKEARPRKIAKSASTAERPAFKPSEEGAPADGAPAPAGERPAIDKADLPATDAGGPKSERRWDVRAERPAGAGPRPPRRRFGGEAELPARRPGVSGGRAMPELPNRNRVTDRANPEFVDRWLSQKPRPPAERPSFDRPRGDRPQGDRPQGDRRDRGPRHGEGRGDARPPVAQARPVQPRAPERKLPTLSETILVGLPKVAVEGQRDKSANKPKTAKEALLAKTAQAAPAKAEKAAPKAKVELKKEWLSAGAAGAIAALKEAGEAGERLVEAWTQANDAAAIVEAANDESVASAARKAARRALNTLRARNIAIPERATAKPAVAPADEEVTEATFTPPDSRGTTSFTIARRRGGDRAHIAEVIIRDEVGIIHAVSGYMSRSQIKEAHQRVADGSGSPPVAVPVEWVRARIAEAKKANATSQVLLPIGLDKCKDLIEPLPASEPAHPLSELEKSLGDAAASTGSGALHSEPEFRSWLPDARALDELLRKVGGAMTQEEAKDGAKVDSVMKEELKAATDRFFTPETRAVVARRIRDAAISLRQRLGEQKAKEALSLARAVEQAGLITSPPHEVEFLLAFFQKGIAVLAQQSGGQLRVPMAQG